MIRADVEVLQEPKSGATAGSCDDASWPSRDDTARSSDRYRVAVADGATESYLAGRWASRLAETFSQVGCVPIDLLSGAAQAWNAIDLPAFQEQREADGRPIQWYEEPLLARGSFATIVGLELREPGANGGELEWQAIAIGDSCLFQVRDDKLLRTFPPLSSADFGSTPALAPSSAEYVPRALQRVMVDTGTWEPWDFFFLATDALAAWTLRAHEHGESPWRLLEELNRPAPDLHEWVTEERAAHRLRDDDVTLIRVIPRLIAQ